MEHSDPASK